jgi:hypothetical protein
MGRKKYGVFVYISLDIGRKGRILPVDDMRRFSMVKRYSGRIREHKPSGLRVSSTRIRPVSYSGGVGMQQKQMVAVVWNDGTCTPIVRLFAGANRETAAALLTSKLDNMGIKYTVTSNVQEVR